MKRTILPAAIFLAGIATSPSLASADQQLELKVPEPRLAIGATYGRLGVDTGHDAASLALQGHLRLGRLTMVGEIGKEEIEDLSRTDRHLGGTLRWHMTRGLVAPYLSAGGGVVRSEMFNGGLVYDDLYGQAGAGVGLRLSPRLTITADAALGQRERLRWVRQDVLLLTIYMPETVRYNRVSIGLVMDL
jgi:hypothetical protein